MRVFYCFRSELKGGSTKWRRMDLQCDVWEQVRYHLEMKHLQASRRHMWSYMNASLVTSPDTPLRAHDTVLTGTKLVLVRRPYPMALAKTESHGGRVSTKGVFVPMTEDEKIKLSMSSEFTRDRRDNLMHPSEYEYREGIIPVPPVGYVCLGCNRVRHHFRADCPNDVNPSEEVGRSLDKVQRPYGIPKSQLRKVNEAERGNAMKDDEGNYVVRVTNQKPRFTARPTPVQTHSTHITTPSKDKKEVGTDWLLADHFCISYMRRRKRIRIVNEEEDQGGGDAKFDFEAVLEGQDAHIPKPTKKKHNTVCTHWLRGMCSQGGLRCDFVHQMDPHLMPECKFYRDGNCVNQDMCMFRHVEVVKPLRLCPHYVAGFCPRGPKCSLDHVKRDHPVPGDFTQWGAPPPFR